MTTQSNQPDVLMQLDPEFKHDLPPELLLSIVRVLPANEIALTGRLINKATAAHFRGPQFTTVRLSLPSPPHAFAKRWGSPGAMRGLTLAQRRQLLCLTAASGSLPNLQVAATHAGCALNGRGFLATIHSGCVQTGGAFPAAAAAGQLEVCQWLRQQGCTWESHPLDAAAEAGQRAACEWLLAAGCPWSHAAVYSAARGGHVGLMEWLLQQRPERAEVCNMRLLQTASRGCDLATLQRLYRDWRGARLGRQFKCDILTTVVGSPAPDWQDKVVWLEKQGCPKDPSVCAEAATCSDALSRLAWLRRRGYPVDEMALHLAAERGDVAVMDSLDCFMNEGDQLEVDMMTLGYTASNAARHGHLAALQWFFARFDLNPSNALDSAAQGGHLELVSWLLGRAGGNMRSALFASAATSGNLELLRWLRQRGCPWDASALSRAAEAGCEEALEWLVEQGCRWGSNGDAYIRAARNGDLGTLRCLRRLGCPWGTHKTFTTCVGDNCPLEALRLLLELGCPVNWGEALKKANSVRDVAYRDGVLALQHQQR
ncbi:hypothetical protein Agub_g3443 [Astrephomene gubernaculifera]|uniref:Ankyrin repeat domain-containing protein n=1 Tax=Astrephomene gubernaculifera TaxID=47775 RepID=A0AAD3DLA4_9CHLO|nr:hypothetical protein Agub_g3443 [Astrephomene gubernaculifera]